MVFIEAKGLGLVSTAGEEQVFGYAVNKGVPFLILTDGNLWDFYLSMAAGIPAERRFYQVELKREEKFSEYVEFLEKFLNKNRVVSGNARRAAEQRHENNQEKAKARDAIPRVWQTLVDNSENMLYDLIVEEVGDECGARPELDDVEAFLQGFRIPDDSFKPSLPLSGKSISPLPPKSGRQASTLVQAKASKKSTLVGFSLDKESFNTSSAKETLAEILKKLQDRDPGFMDRLAKETVGRKRRLVARDRNDLYDDPKFVEQSSLDLGNGWWLGHHLSTKDIKKKIEAACEVAGVKFGSQLTLIER